MSRGALAYIVRSRRAEQLFVFVVQALPPVRFGVSRQDAAKGSAVHVGVRDVEAAVRAGCHF